MVEPVQGEIITLASIYCQMNLIDYLVNVGREYKKYKSISNDTCQTMTGYLVGTFPACKGESVIGQPLHNS